MKNRSQYLLEYLAPCILLLAACASSDRVIPESLRGQVDRSVTLSQIKESPDAYLGKLVVLGGAVLQAKRLKDATQLEVLQFPLEGSLRPIPDRAASQGRFIAITKDFLDPATLSGNVPVTIVGEVTGTTTQRLDETEYTYPTIEMRHLKVWDDQLTYARRPGPWWGIGGGIGIGGGGSRGGAGIGLGF
ncbi:MAG: hypothetical protein C4293_06355 [Nitrospiraceae bacterium]